MNKQEAREATAAESEQQRRNKETQYETAGMHTAFIALQPLTRNGRQRALRWLSDALEDIEVPF